MMIKKMERNLRKKEKKFILNLFTDAAIAF